MRFVILDHLPPTTQQDGGTARTELQHFDLMFEVAGTPDLTTFAVPQLPRAVGDQVAGKRISDHREKYLTYEGPVSGNRGEVRRVAFGNWEGSLESEIVLQFAPNSPKFSSRTWTIAIETETYSASADLDSTCFLGVGRSLSLKRLL